MSLFFFVRADQDRYATAIITAAHGERDANSHVRISDTDLATIVADLRDGAIAARKAATGAIGRDTDGRIVYHLHRPLLSVDAEGRGVALCTEQWDVLRNAIAV